MIDNDRCTNELSSRRNRSDAEGNGVMVENQEARSGWAEWSLWSGPPRAGDTLCGKTRLQACRRAGAGCGLMKAWRLSARRGPYKLGAKRWMMFGVTGRSEAEAEHDPSMATGAQGKSCCARAAAMAWLQKRGTWHAESRGIQK